MKDNKSFFAWWKILSIVLLLYVSIAGFISPVPRLHILNETIRNLYFHVPMWFGMTALLLVSCIYSILYLRKGTSSLDANAVEFANTGMLFGILGIVTGMLWAKFTWGAFWVNKDPKLTAAAIAMLIYSGYIVLRGSFNDDQQKARVSAIFNIIAFPTFVALIYILPRLSASSLHPGNANAGNPGFNQYDRDQNMNIIFYSAGLGFILLGVWITTLRVRLKKLNNLLNGIN